MVYITLDQFKALRPKTVDVTVEGATYKMAALSSGAQVEWAKAVETKDPDAQWILIAKSLVEPAIPADLIGPAGTDLLPFGIRLGLFQALEELNGWLPTATDEQAQEMLAKVAAGEVSAGDAFRYFRWVGRIAPVSPAV
jgi:hypothetical protein